MAMKHVDMVQGTEKWHRWRSDLITASIVPAIMGASPHETPYAAIQYLRGLREKQVSEWFTRRGKVLENPARRMIQDRVGDILLPECGESLRTTYLGASFDGIDGVGQPHEIKCPSAKVWYEVQRFGRDSAAYRMYRWQVLAQMYVCESDTGYLHFYYNGQLKTFTIERHAAAELLMLDAIERAYNHKLNNTLPDPNPEKDCYVPEGDEAAEFKKLATKFLEAKAESDLKKAHYDNHKQALDAVGQALDEHGTDFKSVEHADLRISRFIREGGYDVEKLSLLLAEKAQCSTEVVEQMLDKCRAAGSAQVRATALGLKRSSNASQPTSAPPPCTPLKDSCYVPEGDEATRFEALAQSYRRHYAETKTAEKALAEAKKPVRELQDKLNGFGLGFAAVEGFGVRISRFTRPGKIDISRLALAMQSAYAIPMADCLALIEQAKEPDMRQKRITDKLAKKAAKVA